MTDDLLTDELEVWEYHKQYETWLWYQRFRDFYLPQAGKRTLIESYRRYMYTVAVKARKGSAFDAAKITEPTAKWRRAAVGRNPKGKVQAGWIGWADRADSYYMQLERNFEEVMHQRRIESANRSLGRLDKLGDKWDEMFRVAKTLKRTKTQLVPKETVDPETGAIKIEYTETKTYALNVGGLRGLIAAHDDIRTQERREMNQPAKINQNNLANSEGKNMGLLEEGLGEVLQKALQNVQQRRRAESENDENE